MDANLNKVSGFQKDDSRYVDEPPRDIEGSHPTNAPSQASASWPPKSTPTKSTLKALPTVRDHTTDQLGPGGDEYLPREIDDAGEKKVMPNGALHGGREYRCRTFLVPNRGDKLFMLATECARVLGYRDSYLLFNKNRSLFRIIANQTEKDYLVNQEILPFSYRSRQIAIVTARSMFRQFGSRMIVNGRRVRDDYWESKARKQGFTEADFAGEKRPGASKARDGAAAAEQNASLLGGGQVEFQGTTPFTLYRQHHEADVAAKYPGLGVSRISEIIEALWHDEKKEVRSHWERLAEETGGEREKESILKHNIGMLPGIRTYSDVETRNLHAGASRPTYDHTDGVQSAREYVETIPPSKSIRVKPRLNTTGSAYQALKYLSPEPEFSPKVDHAAESKRSNVEVWNIPDDQSAAIYSAEEQSPQADTQRAASLLEGQVSNDQWSPRLTGQVPQSRTDAFDTSGAELSRGIEGPGIFAHVLTQWSSAETVGARVNLLESLGTRRPIALPTAKGIGSRCHGWLRCEWELPSVVRELRLSQSSEVQPLLENFVTITGSHGNIECATCAQFLDKEWKEVGARALEVLSRGVSSLEKPSTKPGNSPSLNWTALIHATETHIIIEVHEEQGAQSFVDAIVWVCAAVRVNPQRQADTGKRSKLHLSKANQLLYFNAYRPVLVYGLDKLTECSDQDLEPQTRCWTGLFNTGIIACRPIERQWGAGLEIPFEMLLDLSGVENVYQVEGGIILVGFFTALVPISRDEATNSIQWHFEEIDGSSGELLKPHSLPSVLRDWYKSQDVNMLRTSKCFVGWFARANILLGTRQLVENPRNKLKWSTETKEHRQSARREGFEASGQLGFTAGPINTGLQLISTWRFHSNVQHFRRHEQYSMALRLGRGNVSVVIDSESKQVWLVPMLSLVLHLCHRYFQEVSSGQAHNPLPFANPSPDGASEAARVLECNGDVLVFGAAGNPDAENLRQLFLRINTNLLNSAATREPSNKKKLFASELMAMVTEPGRGSPLKEMKAPADAESWVGLLERVDFVGVCANIGYLIEPERPFANNCACSALPCNKYLLAAHIRCLDALAQREGCTIEHSLNRVCRLGESVFWNTENVYWTTCPAGGHDTIWNEKDKVLQQISRKEKGKGKNVPRLNEQTVVLQQHLPEDGVVVFGGDTTKRVLQSFHWN